MKLLDRITLSSRRQNSRIKIEILPDMLLDENGWQVEQNHGRQHCADSLW